ncbi:unannotated protein [freshwater metagenome]|uniref:Unannotated protein n=1 Tax=freshwater metagenome TaxID=449393 RepID=A0A6J6NZA7_9ZZZZ
MVGFGVGVVGLGLGVVGLGVGVVGFGPGVVGSTVGVTVGCGTKVPGDALAPNSNPTTTEARETAPITTWLDFLTRQTPLHVFGSQVFLQCVKIFQLL